jgi:GMP synthase-like glutamine amidotransferase
MSHGDHVTGSAGFHQAASTGEVITAMEDDERRIYCAVHPEVLHALSKRDFKEFPI